MIQTLEEFVEIWDNYTDINILLSNKRKNYNKSFKECIKWKKQMDFNILIPINITKS